jgi:hypothetical protein
MTEPLAEVLGLTDLEFEIYKDYQDHGMPDGEKLVMRTKYEAERRERGETPITGAMVSAAKKVT